MNKRSSIGGSLYINFNHRQELNPSETRVLRKPVRGSDVPLFPGRDSLGFKIKTEYNRCLNLAAYRPDTAPVITAEDLVEVKKNEDQAIFLMKALKKKKKDYSQVWKDNFGLYAYNGNNLRKEYDEQDPTSYDWSEHPLLKDSAPMRAAAQKYLQTAEEIYRSLQEVRRALIEILRTYILNHNMVTQQWIDRGRNIVKIRLEVAQAHVDTILTREWDRIVEPHLGPMTDDVAPSYIGSTHTGQKSVTKAYIQFNPDDFDVDGQLVAPYIYKSLAALRLPASKNRFFVRVLLELGTISLLDEKMVGLDPQSVPYLEFAELKEVLQALGSYVTVVERKLIKDVQGIHKDDEDPFDLAIVFA